MKKSPRLPSKLALDSSILTAYFLGEPAGQFATEEILGSAQRQAHCSHLAIAETFYILCRRRDRAFATKALTLLEKTAYVKLESSTELDHLAAAYKCDRTISLADCYVIALAKTISGTATFATREAEMMTENKRKPFDVDLLFIQDYLQSKASLTGAAPNSKAS